MTKRTKMITTIRITSTEEAKTALLMIQAYLTSVEGNPAEAPMAKAEEPKAEAPKKKAPAKKKAPVKKAEEPKAEEPKVEEPSDGDAQPTLAELTALAKETAFRAGKNAVKATINLYGVNLRAVPEEVYGTLADALKAL